MKQKGFTLIELLVVISIIGLLASVVLVALNNTRKKARDARRIADVNQIAKALSIYYSNNNAYPYMDYSAGGYGCGQGIDGTGGDLLSSGLIANKILAKTPMPPPSSLGHSTCGDNYFSGSWYNLNETIQVCSTAAGNCNAIAVGSPLENQDVNCLAWTTGQSWYRSGSYCASALTYNVPLYIQVVK
jgi:prepilin-type N-terminal cleavage/methylation domain-containing protein